jgi:hypothetical protein
MTPVDADTTIEATATEETRPRLLAVDMQPHESVELDDFERARMLAERHRLALVDLAVTGVSPDAVKLVPLRVLERVVAVPYAVDDMALRVALTDPDNIHGIDELRLAAGRCAGSPARTKRSARSSTRPASRSSTRTRATTSRPRTASPRGPSSGSSTRSSSRPPRTGRATSTSSRRRTR